MATSSAPRAPLDPHPSSGSRMPDVESHIGKAEEAVRRKNFDFAIELFLQILEIAPGNARAFSGLRDAAVRRCGGKPPGAAAMLKAAVPRARIGALQAMKKPDAILKACAHYLAINPFDHKVGQTLGTAALQLGHEDV